MGEVRHLAIRAGPSPIEDDVAVLELALDAADDSMRDLSDLQPAAIWNCDSPSAELSSSLKSIRVR